jgi:hypothetical protein
MDRHVTDQSHMTYRQHQDQQENPGRCELVHTAILDHFTGYRAGLRRRFPQQVTI